MQHEPASTASPRFEVEARKSQTWNESFELIDFDKQHRPLPGQSTLTLLRANHHLAHIAHLDELLESILKDAVDALAAQRGSIILIDEQDNLTPMAYRGSQGHEPDPSKARYSRTYSEECFRTGQSLLCRNAMPTQSVKSGDMSSLICALLRSPRRKIGVLQLDRRIRYRANPFTEDDLALADALAASVAVAIETAQLLEAQRDQFLQTVTTLARAVELRDQYTGEHTERVKDYSLWLAEELNLAEPLKRHLEIGTPLHDIGKIGIDDAILRKPTPLTDEEFTVMKTHTVKGAEILSTISSLSSVIPIVRNHHEKWNGEGYPDRLKGDAIALTARIVAVADAFDAMTSDRPYRLALPLDVAFRELADKAGSHFDPDCAKAFLRLRAKVEQRMRPG